MNLGFIGLGHMGLPMARNLVKAGHRLRVYNRTPGRAESLQQDGAEVVQTPADAAENADAVITMLTDDQAIEDVVFRGGLLSALRPGALHVSMSTISVAESQRLADAHRGKGQGYVSAPVFGRPEAAEAAMLFIVAAGPGAAIQSCEPLFQAMGQKHFVVGDNPVVANVVKLSGNFLIASAIEALGEAVALVRKYGMDPACYIEVLTGTLFNAPLYKTYGNLIAQEKYEPAGFRLQLGLKDVRLALAAAEAVSVPLPFASLVRDKFVTGVANGMADKDWSSLARIAAEQAGLKKAA